MDQISVICIMVQSGMVTRYGTNARNKDYNGDGNIDQTEMLRWDDEENDGLGFFEWKPAKHPVYGDIEIGGFDPKFFSQNPPAKHLEPWIRK